VVPTATAFQPVAANHVAETGSPTLKREPSGER
jgi:putative transposase